MHGNHKYILSEKSEEVAYDPHTNLNKDIKAECDRHDLIVSCNWVSYH